jgi:hypothetical protein
MISREAAGGRVSRLSKAYPSEVNNQETMANLRSGRIRRRMGISPCASPEKQRPRQAGAFEPWS